MVDEVHNNKKITNFLADEKQYSIQRSKPLEKAKP